MAVAEGDAIMEGPPLDEPGFPALGMFGGEVNELFGAEPPAGQCPICCACTHLTSAAHGSRGWFLISVRPFGAGALHPQRIVQFSCNLRENMMMRGMGMLSNGGTNATLGVQRMMGPNGPMLSAEAISQGVVQLGCEGLSPLPILQLNTQLAFMPYLCGGMANAMLLTPVGPLIW